MHFCPISGEWLLPVGVKFLVYSFFLKRIFFSHTQKGARLGQEQDAMYILVWLILQDEVVKNKDARCTSGDTWCCEDKKIKVTFAIWMDKPRRESVIAK